ncbi:MAG: dihydrofolate reductase [Sphingomonadales bacterium]|nr:dihydrofolate reductase [Sphingomonadales bacterium]
MRPELFLIYARAANGVIGANGGLPWRLPADLRHFKALTLGKPMIMGRTTFEGFPAPLPGRRHIVLTRDRAWAAAGAEPAHSVAEAIEMAGGDTVAVIGGADVFAQFMPHADWVELTEIELAPVGDTFMPPLDPTEWIESAGEDHPAADGFPAYRFATLRRRA